MKVTYSWHQCLYLVYSPNLMITSFDQTECQNAATTDMFVNIGDKQSGLMVCLLGVETL